MAFATRGAARGAQRPGFGGRRRGSGAGRGTSPRRGRPRSRDAAPPAPLPLRRPPKPGPALRAEPRGEGVLLKDMPQASPVVLSPSSRTTEACSSSLPVAKEQIMAESGDSVAATPRRFFGAAGCRRATAGRRRWWPAARWRAAPTALRRRGASPQHVRLIWLVACQSLIRTKLDQQICIRQIVLKHRPKISGT